eukprot:COSAG06_NODE_673_length_13189_cov_211.299312_7_plen_59_part_00
MPPRRAETLAELAERDHKDAEMMKQAAEGGHGRGWTTGDESMGSRGSGAERSDQLQWS